MVQRQQKGPAMELALEAYLGAREALRTGDALVRRYSSQARSSHQCGTLGLNQSFGEAWPSSYWTEQEA